MFSRFLQFPPPIDYGTPARQIDPLGSLCSHEELSASFWSFINSIFSPF